MNQKSFVKQIKSFVKNEKKRRGKKDFIIGDLVFIQDWRIGFGYETIGIIDSLIDYDRIKPKEIDTKNKNYAIRVLPDMGVYYNIPESHIRLIKKDFLYSLDMDDLDKLYIKLIKMLNLEDNVDEN